MAGVGLVTVSLRRSMNRVPSRRGLSASLNHRTGAVGRAGRGPRARARANTVAAQAVVHRATDMGGEQLVAVAGQLRFGHLQILHPSHTMHQHSGPVRATARGVSGSGSGPSSVGVTGSGKSGSAQPARRSSSSQGRRVSTGGASGIGGGAAGGEPAGPKPGVPATYHVVNCPAASMEAKGDGGAPLTSGAKYEE